MAMPEFPRKPFAAICLLLALGTIALYAPLLTHGFVNYDDPDYILNNPHVNGGLTWSGIIWAFQSGYAANWHPLTWISHMVDCQIFGLHPAGHHLVNVLFHVANTVLLFLLLNYLTGAMGRSAFVAALFAWHPLHVESVAWASERKDVLSAFFWMLTLIAYGHYVKAENKSALSSRSFYYIAALVLFACALMSKPMVVTLPCVLLLLDFWPLQRLSLRTLPKLLIEKIPFFALAFASCLITLNVQKGAIWSTASLPFSFRLANGLVSYVRYISKIFLPTDLALIYPYPHSLPPGVVAATAAVLMALSIIFIFQAKRFPYLLVGWFWFLGTLVPVIGFVQVGVQAMADRYTYLPSIGIFIMATWGVNDLLERSARKRLIGAVAGGGVLIACLALTSMQLSYWRSDAALFAHTVEVTQDNYAAEDCLGKSLNNLGLKNEAAKFFESAVSLEPTYPMAQFDLGMNLLARGNPDEASNHLASAVQLLPGDSVMQYDFGIFLLQHGNTNDAATHFTMALNDQPDFLKARQELQQIQNQTGANRSTH
jgi:tetratricopeptide (TPR) repeat protein